MAHIKIDSIGIIHTPFKKIEDMPIQPSGADRILGTVVIQDQYAEGLADIEGFSHIILIYHFHQSKGYQLTVTPFLDEHPHGLFATRAPKRPNPIGLSIVPLLRREGNTLHISNIDVLDGTPLLDIKPFVPAFDTPSTYRIGWMEGKLDNLSTKRSDDRFNTRQSCRKKDGERKY